MEPWVWAILVPAALAVLGTLWRLFGRQSERSDARNAEDIRRVERRLDDHIAEDGKMHERIVRVETQTEINSREIADLRTKTTGMKHDILGEVTKTLLTWYNDIIDRLMKFFSDIIERLKK